MPTCILFWNSGKSCPSAETHAVLCEFVVSIVSLFLVDLLVPPQTPTIQTILRWLQDSSFGHVGLGTGPKHAPRADFARRVRNQYRSPNLLPDLRVPRERRAKVWKKVWGSVSVFICIGPKFALWAYLGPVPKPTCLKLLPCNHRILSLVVPIPRKQPPLETAPLPRF
jgi:hypothetical protein